MGAARRGGSETYAFQNTGGGRRTRQRVCDPGCHERIGNGWPKAKQLALLRLRRPADFDLETYNHWAVARVTEDDVAEWTEKVKEELAYRLN